MFSKWVNTHKDQHDKGGGNVRASSHPDTDESVVLIGYNITKIAYKPMIFYTNNIRVYNDW